VPNAPIAIPADNNGSRRVTKIIKIATIIATVSFFLDSFLDLDLIIFDFMIIASFK